MVRVCGWQTWTHHFVLSLALSFPCTNSVGEENLRGQGVKTYQPANLAKNLGSCNHPPGCCKVYRSLHSSNNQNPFCLIFVVLKTWHLILSVNMLILKWDVHLAEDMVEGAMQSMDDRDDADDDGDYRPWSKPYGWRIIGKQCWPWRWNHPPPPPTTSSPSPPLPPPPPDDVPESSAPPYNPYVICQQLLMTTLGFWIFRFVFQKLFIELSGVSALLRCTANLHWMCSLGWLEPGNAHRSKWCLVTTGFEMNALVKKSVPVYFSDSMSLECRIDHLTLTPVWFCQNMSSNDL